MRIALVIPDGAADRPHPAYGGGTALAAADLPAMDRLAREGRLGLAATLPEGLPAGSDVANLSVLGYDAAAVYTGRAPLEAAAMGIRLGPGQAVFRANLVTVAEGRMEDHSAGHITTEEARVLVAALREALDLPGAALHPGVSYRHACVLDDAAGAVPDRAPPHDIVGEPVADHPPRGGVDGRIRAIEDAARPLLAAHPVNRRRREAGKKPATDLWLWGGGVMPTLRPFRERFGVEGALITAVDLLRGLARLSGLEIIEVPGATGFYDTDYAGKGRAALAALKRLPFVAVHVEAPDEAGHAGDGEAKRRALESIDAYIVAPLLEEADRAGDLRILCLPDHPTPLEARTHTREPVPFALRGPGVAPTGGEVFTEAAAAGASPLPAAQLLATAFGESA